MSKVDDELTRRLRRAERPVEDDGLLEGLERRRSRRERLRKVQAGMLAFAVLAATIVGFVALRSVFQPSRDPAIDPGLAPPNGLIVFSRVGDDGRSHLFTARPDGTGVEQLTHGATNDTDPAISPDGRWITLVRSEGEFFPDIVTVPFGDPDVEPVEPRFSALAVSPEPAWSADGSMIATAELGHEEPEDDALLIDPLVGDRFGAYFSAPGGDLAHPSWGPGSRIAFATLGPANERETGWDLATVSVDGTGFQSLVAESGDQTAPTWSFDGSRIAYLQPSDGGHEIWTIAPDGTDKTLIATAVEASLEPDLAWAPDGSALLASDGEWIYRVSATPEGDPGDNFEQLVRGVSPSWQPIPATAPPSASPEPSVSSEPSVSPEPELAGRDIGLAFRLCHLQPLGGIDFFGDGTNGKAWTGTKILEDGTCPDRYDDHYGVAVDYTGDGVADSWSGETIEYCGGCEPWKAMDLNGDGRKELMVIVEYFSIMHYGVYTLLDVDGRPEIEPFRVGEPGHPERELDPGKPFTFWIGGDAGLSDWFYCETLPEFWLTGTESPIEPPPGAVKTVHRTHVSLMTDGIAHILFADTYTVPAETHLELPYTSPFHTDPDCGIGVRPG